MAGIKIDPEMLDIYMESLNKLMAGSETDGGNARLEVSGAGKTEDGLVRYNEEVNKLGDDLRNLYGNVGEILWQDQGMEHWRQIFTEQRDIKAEADGEMEDWDREIFRRKSTELYETIRVNGMKKSSGKYLTL